MYSFDPVGSYERESCRAYGSAQSLVQPFLDNMVRFGSVALFFPIPPFLPRSSTAREEEGCCLELDGRY